MLWLLFVTFTSNSQVPRTRSPNVVLELHCEPWLFVLIVLVYPQMTLQHCSAKRVA